MFRSRFLTECLFVVKVNGICDGYDLLRLAIMVSICDLLVNMKPSSMYLQKIKTLMSVKVNLGQIRLCTGWRSPDFHHLILNTRYIFMMFYSCL